LVIGLLLSFSSGLNKEKQETAQRARIDSIAKAVEKAEKQKMEKKQDLKDSMKK
jgi:hypothetical protein